jgi:hypothetical protein
MSRDRVTVDEYCTRQISHGSEDWAEIWICYWGRWVECLDADFGPAAMSRDHVTVIPDLSNGLVDWAEIWICYWGEWVECLDEVWSRGDVTWPGYGMQISAMAWWIELKFGNVIGVDKQCLDKVWSRGDVTWPGHGIPNFWLLQPDLRNGFVDWAEIWKCYWDWWVGCLDDVWSRSDVTWPGYGSWRLPNYYCRYLLF